LELQLKLAIKNLALALIGDYTAIMESPVKETTVTETAVTLPSDLFQRTEDLARQLGISRDELYRRALSRFLAAHQETEITRQLNELYDQEDSSLDPVLMQMQMLSLEPEKW
jgi:hypothetical protein